VLILNEYDTIINDAPYSIHSQGLGGIWQFRGRKVYAFSATSSTAYERLINNCVATPKVLKFKSEYEHVHGTSPVQEAVIRSFKDNQLRLISLEEDILKNYDHKPMVVIYNLENAELLETILTKSKLRYAVGCSSEVLEQAKQWEYGVLLLKASEGRGVDCRFRKDALVLIVAEVESYHELQQMVGRSSRSRGICEGVLYKVGMQTASQVVDRLKR